MPPLKNAKDQTLESSAKVMIHALLDTTAKKTAATDATGTCTVLAKKGEDCATSYQCDATTLCLEKKCADVFTLEKGIEVKFTDATEASYGDYACKSGLVKNTKCAEYKYDTEAKNIANGVVTCDYKAKCKYVYEISDKAADNVKEEKDCSCGNNAEGQGYCPLSYHDATIGDRYTKVTEFKKENLGAGLHTKNKFTNSVKGKESKNFACQQVYLGVGSYKALDCFKSAVCTEIASGFLRYSLFALLGLLFFLF